MQATQLAPEPLAAHSSSRRATVSAVMIVKNEESVIEECLESLEWVDEIVILDSGSSDRTVELAQQRGANVHVRSDWAGYGVQRQRAQAFANGDYILAIDADERVTPQLRASIESVLENPDDRYVYEVVRTDWFLGKFLYAGGWHRQTHVRLYANQNYSYNANLVHESVDTKHAAGSQAGRISAALHVCRLRILPGKERCVCTCLGPRTGR